MEEENLYKWTIKKLREHLRDLNLPVSGHK